VQGAEKADIPVTATEVIAPDTGAQSSEKQSEEAESSNHRSERSDEDLESDEFVVDKVLGYDFKDGGEWYKVRWKGYGAADDTWEPSANLEMAPEAILAFKEQWNHTYPDNPFIL
jgi:hypothetical protein